MDNIKNLIYYFDHYPSYYNFNKLVLHILLCSTNEEIEYIKTCKRSVLHLYTYYYFHIIKFMNGYDVIDIFKKLCNNDLYQKLRYEKAIYEFTLDGGDCYLEIINQYESKDTVS